MYCARHPARRTALLDTGRLAWAPRDAVKKNDGNGVRLPQPQKASSYLLPWCTDEQEDAVEDEEVVQ
jgi:hypothetical protein